MNIDNYLDNCGEGDYCEVTEAGVTMPGFETCLLILSNTGFAYHLVTASNKILDERSDFWSLLPVDENLSEISVYYNESYHNEEDYPGFDNIDDLIHKLSYVSYHVNQIGSDVRMKVYGVKSNLLIDNQVARVSSFTALLKKVDGDISVSFQDECGNQLNTSELTLEI